MKTQKNITLAFRENQIYAADAPYIAQKLREDNYKVETITNPAGTPEDKISTDQLIPHLRESFVITDNTTRRALAKRLRKDQRELRVVSLDNIYGEAITGCLNGEQDLDNPPRYGEVYHDYNLTSPESTYVDDSMQAMNNQGGLIRRLLTDALSRETPEEIQIVAKTLQDHHPFYGACHERTGNFLMDQSLQKSINRGRKKKGKDPIPTGPSEWVERWIRQSGYEGTISHTEQGELQKNPTSSWIIADRHWKYSHTQDYANHKIIELPLENLTGTLVDNGLISDNIITPDQRREGLLQELRKMLR
ncbi:hypothetical protein CMI48_03855 [Candidatus Pacearchaeota archaeon]|nr:hypothetical protein [Candidatus Pacearchaeota archaeon]MAE49936.1 hypothetical protein [Candidatus Pacearchaeota archaeon]